MKKPNESVNVQPTTLASENNTQVQHLRKTMKAQVALLKQTIFGIQQESLKSMQDAINTAFKTLTADNLEQVNQQDQNIKEQLNKAMEEAEQLNKESLTNIPEANTKTPISTTDSTSQTTYGLNSALQQDTTSIAQAMAIAQNSINTAQKLVNQLVQTNSIHPQAPATPTND
jgi:hypothetical protein